MSKLLTIGAMMVAVAMFGSSGAFAQSRNHGIQKPHYGSDGNPGRSYSSRGRSFNYARPSFNYARPSYNYAMPQPMIASEPAYRSFSFEPIGINPGDTVVVNRDDARLMLGRNVVGTAPKGLEFKVTKVINGWFGAVVDVDGQKLSGWIWNRNVRPVQEAPPAGS